LEPLMMVSFPTGHRLTPEQVQQTRFPSSRLGRRGLDEGEIQVFRDRVEEELVLLHNEKASLLQEVERLRHRLLNGADEGPAADLRPDGSHVQAVQVLAKAQQTADRYVSDAQEYCRELTEDARRARDEIVAEARANAASMLDQAHRDASKAAAAVPASAEPLSTGERQRVESELAYLRTFSDVCRTHLRAYLEALARNVEEWERAEKASMSSLLQDLPRNPATVSQEPRT
jgi:cell division septum initiation protein DivIVA